MVAAMGDGLNRVAKPPPMVAVSALVSIVLFSPPPMVARRAIGLNGVPATAADGPEIGADTVGGGITRYSWSPRRRR